MKLVLRLICACCLLAGTALAQSPVTIAINTQSPGSNIPPDFLGLSFETANLQYNGTGVNGYMFDSTNTQLVTIFTNLGIKNLRIGGISVDTNNLMFPQYTPTNQDIDALFRFAGATGVKVEFSLRLENGIPSQDSAIASYTWTNYNQYLTGLAIGNEPNGYGKGDPTITNFSSYLARWSIFASAVSNAVPGVKLVGPDSSSSSWVPGFASAENGSSLVKLMTSHQYVGGNSGSLTIQQIISGMLSSSWDTSSYPSYYNVAGAGALTNGFPFHLTEFNSYVAPYPGTWGGNNCFASALFALDGAHWWASHNCSGVNFHTFLGKYNATIYYDANGNYQFYPIGYGIKGFDVGGHGTVNSLAITNVNGLNLTAYAVTDTNNNLFVTIINKEFGTNARDASVTIAPYGFLNGNVMAMFLTSPGNSPYATNGITIGGATITNNAPWAGQWTTLNPLTNGQCTVTVPATSAAILQIQPTTLFYPPVIVQDLPAQVPLVAGKSYSYSIGVESLSPISYQWYENGSPIIGATNGTYSFTAAQVGCSNNYYVVITNMYDAVTSMISTVTIIPQLSNFYARQNLQYLPAGYWPLQETNPPAPATIETNYGTLGALGNAYYAMTNAGDVVFGQPGALAAGNTAVGFQGTAHIDSFAFVPRAAPALTLRPPFSLEVWVNADTPPSGGSANTQDLISEGGSGLDSPAGDGVLAGIRVAWVYVNQSGLPNGPGFSILVYTNKTGALVYYQVPVSNADQWYHCVVTYDGVEAMMYVDGALRFSTNITMNIDTWSPLTIGTGRWQGYAPTRGLSGLEDEVAVYTNVLSSSQIANHYLAGTSASSNYDQVVLNDGPLLYYHMDCPGYATTAPILSPVAVNYGSAPVNGYYPSGTVPGSVAGPAMPSLGSNVKSSPGNGIFSSVDVGNDPSFNPVGSQPFTALVWFRTYPSDGRVQAMISHGANGSWSLDLVGTNGTVVWSSGAGSVASTKVLNDGNWHFAAGVFDGVNNYLYIDGALNSASAASGSVIGNSDDVLLGGDPDFTLVGNNEQYFAGALAQAAFYTNALTPSQITSIYLAGVSSPPPLELTLQNSTNRQFQLDWNYGVLQEATNVSGPYIDLTGTASPCTVLMTNLQQFFRIKND